MASVVVDDHLVRDIFTGSRPPDLGGKAERGIATTGLWLFRLSSSYAQPTVAGKLSSSVAVLAAEARERFRAHLTALPGEIEVLPLSELSWSMAELQHRHRGEGRSMSVAMVEALAAAHRLHAAIAVSVSDVGPNLRDSARADGIAFHIVDE